MKSIGLLLSILLFSGKSWACFCGSPPSLTKEILNRYPYVALVKVKTMDDLLRPVNQDKRLERDGRFTVDVIENFREALPDTFILESYLTSCDIGLRPGQTWVIFARMHNGYATVYACDYSVQHGGQQPVGEYENLRSQSAEELLNTVRQLTGKPIRATNGRLEKFYSNGQRALLTTYQNKGQNEERMVWHANGRLWGKEYYSKGLKNGPATWWNANGTPRSTETFVGGIAVDTSRHWHNTDTDTLWLQSTRSLSEQARDSILQFNKRSHIQSVTIADRRGRLINSRQYDWYGKLVDETVGVPETGIEWRTSYDKQGNINFLMVKRTTGNVNVLYAIEYQPDGSRRTTYYDEKGRLIRWTSIKDGVETVLEEKKYPD